MFAEFVYSKLVACARNSQGHIAVTTAFLGLPLVFTAGYAVEYNRAEQSRSAISSALDAAALAAVIPDGLSTAERKEYATGVFEKNYFGNVPVTLEIQASREEVSIVGIGAVSTLTSGAFGVNSISVRERSKAVLTKADVVCILALDPTGDKAIEFTDQAKFQSPACSVQANSVSAKALYSKVRTPPTAKSFCTAGISDGTFKPFVKHACTPVDDPYENLRTPKDGRCVNLNKITVKEFDDGGERHFFDVIDNNAVLYPGTYCRGLKVEGVNVRFMPGVYIFKNEKLEIKKEAQAQGQGVTFVLKGDKASVKIESGATLMLSAQETGPYEGLVFFQSPHMGSSSAKAATRSNKKVKIGKSEIGASGGLTIVGTAYFPTQELIISSEIGVAAQSPATAFIAYRLKFKGKSVTKINVDHEKGGIPPLLPRSDEGARLVQ